MTKDAGAWEPKKGERVVIDGHRWWARAKAGDWPEMGPQQIPPWYGEGTILRRLPAGEIADYEVVMDGDGDPLWRTYCYHRDELTRA